MKLRHMSWRDSLVNLFFIFLPGGRILVSNNCLTRGKLAVKPQGRMCGGLVAEVHASGILMWCSVDCRRISDEVWTFPIEGKGPPYTPQVENPLTPLSSLHHVMQISSAGVCCGHGPYSSRGGVKKLKSTNQNRYLFEISASICIMMY